MSEWQPIETAPKDRPILAWCDHEADPYVEDPATGRLTLYAAHAEGMYHAPTGLHILEWGGGWHDSYEDGGAGLPDWWFVVGIECEAAANPTHWQPLPEPPPSPPWRAGTMGEVVGETLRAAANGMLPLKNERGDYGLLETAADAMDALVAEREALRAEVERLKRLAADRAYMAEAYRNMLGPKGQEVAAMWDRKGVTRTHVDWGPEAETMTGEQRAEILLGIDAALHPKGGEDG